MHSSRVSDPKYLNLNDPSTQQRIRDVTTPSTKEIDMFAELEDFANKAEATANKFNPKEKQSCWARLFSCCWPPTKENDAAFEMLLKGFPTSTDNSADNGPRLQRMEEFRRSK